MKRRERREISGIEALILALMLEDCEKAEAPKKAEAQPKPKRVERKREP